MHARWFRSTSVPAQSPPQRFRYAVHTIGRSSGTFNGQLRTYTAARAREAARSAEQRIHAQLAADDRETLMRLLRTLAFPEG